MKRFHTWILVLGAVLVSSLVCQGQGGGGGGFGVANPNAGPALTITGTVFDPSGAPAPGVLLLLAPPTAGQNAPIKSDANGKYTLNWQARQGTGGLVTASEYSLFARDLEHNVVASHAVDATTTSLDLRLQPGLAISTKVQDVNGKPISSATANLIIFLGANGIGFSITRPPVKADETGRVQIAALPQGYSYNLAVSAPGYGVGRTPMIEAADTQTNRLELPAVVLRLANLKLAGQVLGADGQPAAAARITIAGQGQPSTNTQTDATGHFALTLCEGAVSVTASLQGAAGRAQTVGGDTNVIIRLGNNNPQAGMNIALPGPARGGFAAPGRLTITGTVFDPSGAPAPGVAMSVTPGAGLLQDARSDAGGKFTVSWTPINFVGGGRSPTVQYLLMGRDLERNFAATAGIDEQTTSMDLHLQGGLTLSGTVQDNSGAPVRTATLRLIMMTPPMSSQFNRQPGTVDEQGAFTMGALPQGQAYNLNVSAPGFGSASTPVAANQTQTASLQLPPIKLNPADQRLEGQVVGPDDQPVPGAMVRVMGVGQPNDSTRSDASGHFALQVCEGSLRVYANVPANTVNGQLGSAMVQAQAGDLNVVVKLGARQAAPGGFGMAPQAPARLTPLKEQSWTWTALGHWPQRHRVAVIVLLSLQLTAMLGAAGAILWLTRRRQN